MSAGEKFYGNGEYESLDGSISIKAPQGVSVNGAKFPQNLADGTLIIQGGSVTSGVVDTLSTTVSFSKKVIPMRSGALIIEPNSMSATFPTERIRIPNVVAGQILSLDRGQVGIQDGYFYPPNSFLNTVGINPTTGTLTTRKSYFTNLFGGQDSIAEFPGVYAETGVTVPAIQENIKEPIFIAGQSMEVLSLDIVCREASNTFLQLHIGETNFGSELQLTNNFQHSSVYLSSPNTIGPGTPLQFSVSGDVSSVDGLAITAVLKTSVQP